MSGWELVARLALLGFAIGCAFSAVAIPILLTALVFGVPIQ